MRFKVESNFLPRGYLAGIDCAFNDYFTYASIIRKVLEDYNLEIDNDDVYIDVNTLEELRDLSYKLVDNCSVVESDLGFFKPDSFIIDFQEEKIWIYDYYAE